MQMRVLTGMATSQMRFFVLFILFLCVFSALGILLGRPVPNAVGFGAALGFILAIGMIAKDRTNLFP